MRNVNHGELRNRAIGEFLSKKASQFNGTDVLVFVPVHNEENTVAKVIKDVKDCCNFDLLMIDDGSTDSTPRILRQLDVEVLTHPPSMNSDVILSGLRVARALGYKYAVKIDGDGQHNPDEIPILLNAMVNPLRHKPDVVIDSRFLGEYSVLPRYRKFGIDVITWLYNVGSKWKIEDSQCCFRAYSRRVIEACPITENGFGFSTEILVKARKAGFGIMEVPISCIYHEDFRRNSTLNPLRHGLSVAFKTIKWRLKAHG